MQQAQHVQQPATRQMRGAAFKQHTSRRSLRLAAAATGRADTRPQAAATHGATSPCSRRDLALGGLGASLGLAQLLAAAPVLAEGEAAQAQRTVDAKDGFSLQLPPGWVSSEGVLEGNSSFTGASGARRTVAWTDPSVPAADLNVTLVITNTSVEFTKLGSFGNVFTFGQNLVNSMDRSFLLRSVRNPLPGAAAEPIQVAKLLDAKDARDMYMLEYTVQKVPGPHRHLYSVVALANNGRYNRLYTLTAQCLEEQVGQYEQVLQGVINSFQPPASAAARV